MDNIYTYLMKLPPKIHEMVTPCEDGYTVYINNELDEKHRVIAYKHALTHIINNDFDSDESVQEIEKGAHDVDSTN